MSIKILTKTGEEVTHIDDARAYNFDAGNRSGIVKGAYNEGRFFAVSNNVIGLDSCELRIAGHRVIIDSAESFTFNDPPEVATKYSIIAEISVDNSSVPNFRLFPQASNIALVRDTLYKNASGVGTYQLEIGTFTLNPDKTVSNVVRTAHVITGGADVINVGNVNTTTLSPSQQASVEVSSSKDNAENNYLNFDFYIPQGIQGIKGDRGEKGEKGDSGLSSGAVLSNTAGTSDINGYTQKGVNSIILNPNLLINGDFRVNQRRQTSYTTLNKYTVDRWLLIYGSLVVNSDGSITHTATNTWQGLVQYIEHPSRLAGKTITFSANSTSDRIRTISIKLLKNGSSTSTTLKGVDYKESGNATLSVTVTIPSDITDEDKLYVLLYTPQANQSVTWYWSKVEIGSVATAFSPRPYAEELALCQRYYQIRNNAGLIGTSGATTYIAIMFDYICEMRIKPTLKHLNPVTMRTSGVNYTQTSATSNAFYGDNKGVVISLTNFVNNPTNVTYIGQENQDILAFDAEIY